MYLRLKSFQRFTETWALLERCGAGGLFGNGDSPGMLTPTGHVPPSSGDAGNTKGYSSTYLATSIGFANVRAGTRILG